MLIVAQSTSLLKRHISDYNSLVFYIKYQRSGRHLPGLDRFKPLCCWWLIWPIQNDAKILKNH